MKNIYFWFRHLVVLLTMPFLTASCTTEDFPPDDAGNLSSPMTRAVPTPTLEWENVDWMPTPAGQSRIPSPWVGAGSITPTYGIEITNDRYKKDGWELVYNSFDPNSPGHLVNPYFVLYNKYRGLLRIYLYVTTQFVATSSYLQDGLSVISQSPTTLLNFLGKDIAFPKAKNTTQYTQIQPAPSDGSSPLAANKWYMMQYELAYDPDLSSTPYNQIQLAWHLNYCNIQTVNLGGEIQGRINGTIGSGGTKSENPINQLAETGRGVGIGVISGIGLDFLEKNTTNTETGQNTLGLPNSAFKSIISGLSSALSGTMGSLPGKLIGILSGIFGSGTQGQPIPIDLKIRASITLTGSITEKGSFPSTPISFWVPGTSISSDAVGYIPLYNKSLGVLAFPKQEPVINSVLIQTQDVVGMLDDPYDGSLWPAYELRVHYNTNFDFSTCLIFNPEVLAIADITIRKQDIITQDESIKEADGTLSCRAGYVCDHIPYGSQTNEYYEYFPSISVKFTIEVKPKNGAASSIIIKTVNLKENRTY